MKDVRYFQILILSGFLGTGAVLYDFSLMWSQVLLTFVAGGVTQAFWIRLYRLPIHSYLSMLITCLGLSLLLRADSLWVHPLIACFSICSKFWFQVKRKHYFNPTAIGLFVALLVVPGAWVSPGQWGSTSWLAVLFILFGCFVTHLSKSLMISWFFLLFYGGGLWLRNYYLGYEFEIFWRQMMNGSVVLFAFFMISDPKTIPFHWIGKVCQAFGVAALSLFLHYYMYVTNGFIHSLVLVSFLVPLFNHWLLATPFQWRSRYETYAHSH